MDRIFRLATFVNDVNYAVSGEVFVLYHVTLFCFLIK